MIKSALVFLLAVSPAFSETLPPFSLNKLGAPAAAGVPLPALLPVPGPAKASHIQITSAIKLKMEKEKGQLTITFPKVDFGDEEPGDKAHLFVKMLSETPAPVISWATVICSGRHYVGYKGSTLRLPESSGNMSINEMLAMGSYPKRLIERTHPWLTDGLADLEEVCSAEFLEKMKDARAETLPPRIGNFNFDYNPRKNTLKASWK